MIYRFTFLIVFAFCASAVFSQPGNLVENPGFEERIDCIYNSGDVEQAPPWFNPTGATPDLYHECAVQLEDPCPYPEQVYLDPWFFGVPTNTLGCQEPRTGVGYAGLLFYHPTIFGNNIDWREYLAVPLTEPMIEGESYLVRFYVSLAERSKYAVHAIQVLFTSFEISEPSGFWGVLNHSPQISHSQGNYIADRENWTELSWEYTADGTEQYMYIGNFQSNAEIDTLFAIADSIDPEDHFGSYYYIDDVYVGTEILSSQSHVDSFDIRLWPNPVEGILTVGAGNPILQSLSLYTVMGALIRHYPVHGSNNFELDVGSLAAGSYILVATDQNGLKAAKHFVKR